MEPELLSQDRDADRIPCPDDMCTGILDEHGACGTCGRRGDGAVREARADVVSEKVREGAHADSVSAADETPVAAEISNVSDAIGDAVVSGDDRVPCSDEMCVGVMGENGRCGTCGRND